MFGLEKCLQPALEGSIDTAACYCAPQIALHIFYAQGGDMYMAMGTREQMPQYG